LDFLPRISFDVPPCHPVGVNLSGFPNFTAHFKHMHERPSVKKLLAYEKEVNEGFAKTA
jgi:hypothetical protein